MTLTDRFGIPVQSPQKAHEELVEKLYDSLGIKTPDDQKEAVNLAQGMLALAGGYKLRTIANACMMVMGTQMCAMPEPLWLAASQAAGLQLLEHIRANDEGRKKLEAERKAEKDQLLGTTNGVSNDNARTESKS